MNITIKDVPPELHERLREVAERNGRSLNKQIVYTLEQSVTPKRVDRSQLLSRIRRRREAMEIWLEDDALENAIQDGRE